MSLQRMKYLDTALGLRILTLARIRVPPARQRIPEQRLGFPSRFGDNADQRVNLAVTGEQRNRNLHHHFYFDVS